MNLSPRFFRTAAVLFFSFVLTRSGSAQSILFAEHKGGMLAVKRAHGSAAIVEVDGRDVVADGNKFALQKTEEFLPVFVAVHDLKVRSSHVELMGEMSGDINHTFEFNAAFESAYALKDTFVVLELNFSEKTKGIFLREIGTLEPHKRQEIHLALPLSIPLGEGHYHVHIFTAGREVFHSEQPFAYREAQLDHMVARRIKQLNDADPAPLFGPPPEYPASFAKTKVKGQANVKFRISPKGVVIDPVAVSSSDPAFAEAAVAAMRQWRFLPRMKAGRPVETSVELPVIFTPPEKS